MRDTSEQFERPAIWNGTHLLAALRAAEEWLKHHVAGLNQLNVFPVPDGDTGTNMHLTLAAALRDVEPMDSCGELAERVYRAALMGARGNSGVILSQILRGLASGLAGRVACTADDLVHALRAASEAAYKSTDNPREGTILTVIREAGEAVYSAPQRAADVVGVLRVAVDAAHDAVERTPQLLDVLREAGVVDAGGKGLALILEGMLRWGRGDQSAPATSSTDALHAPTLGALHGEDDHGYCTNALVRGTNIPLADIRAHLNDVGSSVVVVGDATLLRLHVHTPRPGDILTYAQQYGELLNIEITNMDEQRRELQRPAPAASAAPAAPAGRGAVVAVAAGAGFVRMFRSLGAGEVVAGGQSMNPSTQELLAAIERLPHDEVLLLPNNKNVVLAARQAAELAAKQVHVLPSTTLPQGIAALVRFAPDADLARNVAQMQPELAHVQTLEITTAVRSTTWAGQQVQAGQTIGIVDGALVAVGDDPLTVIATALAHMHVEQREMLTVYTGQDAEPAQDTALTALLATRYPELEIEVQAGGQPVYPYILAAE